MADKTITGIVTWLKGWFYTKDEITTKENALQTQINNKASQSDLNTLSSNVANKLDASDYVIDSALSSSSTNPVQNKVINTALLSKANLSDVPVNTSDLMNDGVDGINSFVSDDDSRLSDARTPTSHTHGYINNDGTIDVNSASFSTLNYPLVRDNSDGKLKTGLLSTYSVKDSRAYSNIGSSANADQTTINGKINTAIGNINTSLSNKAPSIHTHSSADVTEASALTHIGTSANATQHTVNTAIDTAIGNLLSIQAIQVVSTLPTASADTMGGLYIINENSKVNVYYTEQDGSSYAWHKMDTDILDELSIAWSDVTGRPSVIDWDTLTFVPKATDESGAITFDYLE